MRVNNAIRGYSSDEATFWRNIYYATVTNIVKIRKTIEFYSGEIIFVIGFCNCCVLAKSKL